MTQKQTEIDALGAIVKLALVNSQPRSLRKRPRKTVFGKKTLEIISNAFRKGFPARLVSGQGVDFGESLHHKTSVIMVNKIAHAIDGIEPRAVGILCLQDEIEIPLG